MNLQDTFYILGIVFMSVSLLLLIGLIVLVFYIKVKIAKIQSDIQEKIDDINTYAVRPVKKVVDIAESFISNRKKKRK